MIILYTKFEEPLDFFVMNNQQDNTVSVIDSAEPLHKHCSSFCFF
jgi:hypothetical protein